LKRDEAIVGAVIFLFGGVTVLLSLKMDIGTFRAAGAGMFPLILGVLLMILSGAFVSRIFLEGNERAKKKASPESSESPKQLILFLGTMVLVTLFFNQWGYPLSAFLLMLALLRVLGVKKWTLTLPLSLMVAVACYFLFVQWLKIPLPKGWIGI
jgi:putative tricarboxylic transport membrane protein